ncbi:MAG TPA: ABC transporter permease subunit [Xanthobacteraceae bacterium]|nr:ABC transporter permease subunit [Xanthobacteraceae bacterium]
MLSLLSFGDTGYGAQLAFGALLTVEVASFGYALALVLGTAIALATRAGDGWRWALWRGYASIFMSVPSLLVIFFIYFGGGQIVDAALRLVGLSARLQVTPFAAGVAGLSIVYAAYLAEVVRSAIWNVPRGQFEAAAALRIPPWLSWLRIISPQVLRLALPGLVNLWIVVMKDTALVSLVGLKDIIAQAKTAAGSTREPFLFYIVAACFFVAMNWITFLVAGRLERRTARALTVAGA